MLEARIAFALYISGTPYTRRMAGRGHKDGVNVQVILRCRCVLPEAAYTLLHRTLPHSRKVFHLFCWASPCPPARRYEAR